MKKILETRPTRTAHLLLRRQLLYPDELVSHGLENTTNKKFVKAISVIRCSGTLLCFAANSAFPERQGFFSAGGIFVRRNYVAFFYFPGDYGFGKGIFQIRLNGTL